MFLFFWLLYHDKRNYIAVYNEYNTNSYDITITLPRCIYQEKAVDESLLVLVLLVLLK